MVIRRSSLLFTLLFQNVQVMWAANTVWYRQLIKIGERGTICGRPWMGCFVAFNWPESTLSITFWRWFHYEITRNLSLYCSRYSFQTECKIGFSKQNSFFQIKGVRLHNSKLLFAANKSHSPLIYLCSVLINRLYSCPFPSHLELYLCAGGLPNKLLYFACFRGARNVNKWASANNPN